MPPRVIEHGARSRARFAAWFASRRRHRLGATAQMERADALLFGRVTYAMMASAWQKPATGTWPDSMDEWQIPYAQTIDRAKKYVVPSTLSGVNWNAELVGGDLAQAVRRLKKE